MNFVSLLNDQYVLDWFENITTQTKGESRDFPRSFNEFGHQIYAKVVALEVDCHFMWGHF